MADAVAVVEHGQDILGLPVCLEMDEVVLVHIPGSRMERDFATAWIEVAAEEWAELWTACDRRYPMC